jgi:hypothetical protein
MSEPVSSVALMIIDCDTCEVRDKACGDCIVSFLTIPVRAVAKPSDERREGVTRDVGRREILMDADQQAAVDALVAGGLVPPLRLVPNGVPQDAPRAPRRERRVSAGRHAS